jgi:site-specific DNA-methyltransferase (adenine-specific)
MQLIRGDCLEVLKDIPNNSIDCIICDLPYGVTAQKWDSIIDFEALWTEYRRVCRVGAIVALFASNEFTFKLYNSNPSEFKYKLIWKKNVPTGMNQARIRPMKYYEEILIFQIGGTSKDIVYNPQMKPRVGKKKQCYNYNHYCASNSHLNDADDFKAIKKRYNPDFVQPSDILEFDTIPNRKGRLHPTEKPVPLLEWLVATYTNPSDTVLDSCMGVGSTGVACKNLGRNFIGIELEDKYYKIAEKRLS